MKRNKKSSGEKKRLAPAQVFSQIAAAEAHQAGHRC
jgi:hypothetical protein